MPHIHTQPHQHDHTVTAYIIRTDGNEPRALLHMHKKLSKLLAIGGHIELDETPWGAVSHEITEESGYSLADLHVLQPKERISALPGVILHPYPLVMNTHQVGDDHWHSDTSYGFIARGQPTMNVQDGESADLRWYTQAELLQLSPQEVSQNAKQTYEFMFQTPLNTWDKVDTSYYSTTKNI